ncbi:MAG TPA: PQQ-dependent sugar dehydrogenase, partial [Anaerolineales bacterium]|nr:PQQ-dependent sugar dehydrogenase [Anaerolineales bacterium]
GINFVPVPSLFLWNTTKQIVTSSLEPSRITFQEIASGLTKPVFITHAGDGSERIFVLELPGRIRIIKNGLLLSTPFLDIHSSVNSTGSEQGLLALAFHPSYSSNGEFFVAYTAPRNGDSTGSNLVLQKFSVSASNPDQADSASSIILLTIAHPTYANHNGGTLAFGRDGYLYWSVGDGGGSGDPNNNAQALTSLLGKVLRIDVDSGSPYTIPASNPFYSSVDPNIKKEIWAYGLRNPWRFSFDRQTGDLYIGDVGQSVREEIDFQPSSSVGGENYGWRVMEGSICYNPSSGCNQSGKILPVSEYDHTLGCAVTGGYVYRGSNFPSLRGLYFYSDYCSGRFFSLQNNTGTWNTMPLVDTPYVVSTFGEDEPGELYLADYGTGKLYGIGYQEGTVAVTIANTSMGSSPIALQTSIRQSYTGINNGPVKVTSTLPIVTSERVAYSPDGGTTWTSHSELMGLPANLVHTSYTFPFYNNIDLNSQLRFGNVGTASTTVTVIIGGQNKGNFTLAPNASRRVSYTGLSAGPVVITSNGQPIIASIRIAYNDGSAWTSFSEMMGLPSNKLTNSYTFPWYNNATLNSQLRFGNVGTIGTTVTVKIGGQIKGTYPLAPNASQRVSYNGLDLGPVVVSSTGQPIIASMRVAYTPDGTTWTDFSEMMGLPTNALSISYSFPAYDNVHHNSQLRFGNVGTVGTNVTVIINGVVKGTYPLAPNASRRISFPGLDSGPVVIQSSGGVPIIASLRVAYTPDGGVTWTSFAEMMGLPQSQLTTSYYFPWYNNLDLDTQLRVGVP